MLNVFRRGGATLSHGVMPTPIRATSGHCTIEQASRCRYSRKWLGDTSTRRNRDRARSEVGSQMWPPRIFRWQQVPSNQRVRAGDRHGYADGFWRRQNPARDRQRGTAPAVHAAFENNRHATARRASFSGNGPPSGTNVILVTREPKPHADAFGKDRFRHSRGRGIGDQGHDGAAVPIYRTGGPDQGRAGWGKLGVSCGKLISVVRRRARRLIPQRRSASTARRPSAARRSMRRRWRNQER